MPISNTPKRVSRGMLRERQRHAPVVVVGLRRGVRRPERRERELQRLLGAGLADAAGHGDDCRVAAPARVRRGRAPPALRACRRRAAAALAHRPAESSAPRWRRTRPGPSAAATKSWPSRLGPRSATKTSPGARLRLSIETPLTAVPCAPAGRRARLQHLADGPERLSHVFASCCSAARDRVVVE